MLTLADAVLLLHVAIVVFVVGGLLAVFAGHALGWRWVAGWRWRSLHALAIAVVVAQAWVGAYCPLTILEAWLRERGGAPGYATSFVGHWLQRLLYVDAPPWAFVVAYTAFGLAVAWAWWRVPPRRRPPQTR
ncbi:MAG: DUF2784 domain-containing protein [Burkholderiales bacterium]|nr:DUF2784 domain-containing protein [Burkholderiales bacterium]